MKALPRMEHRMNSRLCVRLPVTVQISPRMENTRVCTVTRDVALGGACIENKGLDIQEGAMVRLTLELTPGDRVMIDALVLRSNDQGVGLMFAYYSNEVFDRLAELLEPKTPKRYGHPHA